jgi:DNA-binding response OmpR family regulator
MTMVISRFPSRATRAWGVWGEHFSPRPPSAAVRNNTARSAVVACMPHMKVVVLTAEPEVAERDPESLVQILGDLGCDVVVGRFDVGDLDEEKLAAQPPAIVIVDAGDELERGARCLKRLGSYPPLAEAPVLIALALARLPGLDFSAGFGDFILKPVVPAELYARLRQLDWKSATFGSDEVIKVDDLHIDVAGYEARVRGRRLELTHQEFELLRFFAQNRGKVFTREQLLAKVWGYRYYGGSRTVDIHVRRLRAKLGAMAGGLIETVRNVGYKMRGPGSAPGGEDD